MRAFAAAVGLAAALLTTPAMAKVVAKVDISSQTMQVYVDGKLRHSWAISSGKRGHETPTGSYSPYRLEKDWHSRKYDAPMPNAVFYSGGYAVHGSYGRVGGPASRGCIRLANGNAETFYNLVASRGTGSTRIQIVD